MKKNTTKNAFTLIELLAVIVILAIIALIAVPVILNIIDKANKCAFKDSAYGVLSAAEYYYAASQLEVEGPKETVEMETTDPRLELKGSVPNGHVWITRYGKIALAVYNNRYCVTKGFEDEDITITEEFETCEPPTDGENTGGNQGSSGEKTLTNLAVDNFTVSNLDGSDTTVVTKPACLTDGTTCAAGTPVAIQVNENDTYRFYVMNDDGSNVTLIMDRNLGEPIEWISDSDYGCSGSYCASSDKGPITAIDQLVLRTNDWENIPEKNFTVSGIGHDGTTRKFEDIEYTGRARMITHEEATSTELKCKEETPRSCKNWLYINLYDDAEAPEGIQDYEYWTATTSATSTYKSWYVNHSGELMLGWVDNTGAAGLRPVIELAK